MTPARERIAAFDKRLTALERAIATLRELSAKRRDDAAHDVRRARKLLIAEESRARRENL